MMKTLCVAVVVLSLTSVCQPASLVCEKLLKPPDNSPDLSGTWHYIAVSSDNCLASTALTLHRPHVEMNVTSKDTSSVYSADFKFKMYGYCLNKSGQFFYENNTMFTVDNNNGTGNPGVLLQSGCPDCIAIKGEEINSLVLFSRRKSVTAAELKEFETQAECLGWFKPQVLSPDHDYENCKSFEDLIHDADFKKIAPTMLERMKNMRQSIIECERITKISYYETVTSQLEKMAGQ